MRDDNASFFITVRDPVLALGTRRRCGGVGGGTVDVAAVVHGGAVPTSRTVHIPNTARPQGYSATTQFRLCFKQHFATQDGLAV